MFHGPAKTWEKKMFEGEKNLSRWVSKKGGAVVGKGHS